MKSTLNLAKQNWETIPGVHADRDRLLIINELLKRESSVIDLARALSIRTYNISKHLKILEESGLVIKRKKGIKRRYNIPEYLHSYYSENKRVLDLVCSTFEFSL